MAAILEREETVSEVGTTDFEQMMSQEQRRVFLLCLRLLRNRDEADSATQDVFVQAFKTMKKSGAMAIVEPAKWLTRVALNTCYDRLRSKRWRFWQWHASHAEGEEVLGLIAFEGLNQEENAAAYHLSRRLENALGRLSIRQRTAFILRHEEEMSIGEIAEVMGLDPGTVKAHMARAIKKLREELRDLYVR